MLRSDVCNVHVQREEWVVQECAEKKDWLGGAFEGTKVVCGPPLFRRCHTQGAPPKAAPGAEPPHLCRLQILSCL